MLRRPEIIRSIKLEIGLPPGNTLVQSFTKEELFKVKLTLTTRQETIDHLREQLKSLLDQRGKTENAKPEETQKPDSF